MSGLLQKLLFSILSVTMWHSSGYIGCSPCQIFFLALYYSSLCVIIYPGNVNYLRVRYSRVVFRDTGLQCN